MKMKREFKHKKYIVLSVVIFGLLLLSLAFLYVDFIRPARGAYVTEENMSINYQKKIPIDQDTSVKQKFRVDTDVINAIGIAFDGSMDKEGILTVSLKRADEKDVLSHWEYSLEEIDSNSYVMCSLSEPLEVSRGDIYELEIRYAGENGILYQSSGNLKGRLIVDGSETDGQIAYRIVGKGTNAQFMFFLALAAGLVGLLVLISFLIIKEIRIEKIFVVVCLILGTIYLFFIPPYLVPDEPVHFKTTYAISSQLLGENPVNEDGDVLVRKTDIDYYNSLVDPEGWKLNKKAYVKEVEGFFEKVDSKGLELECSIGKGLDGAHTYVISYLPQVIGITFARILKLNAVQLFVMGRFFALVTYVFLMYLAVKAMPFAKMLMFGIGVLPISLQQAASFSYDSIMHASIFCAMAYLLNLMYRKEKVEKKDVIVMSIMAVIFAPIKVIYILILGLGLLIPYQKFGSMKKKWISAGVLLGSGLLPTLIMKITMMGAMAGSSSTGLSWTDEPGYTLGGLLGDPIHFLGILYRTFERKCDFYYGGAIGSTLGWLDFGIPNIFVIGFTLVLFLSVIKVADERVGVKNADRVLMGLITVGVSVAVCLGMLLAWTRASSIVVEGVQGRYFLPVLPLIFLILRNKSLELKKNIDYYLIYAIVFLQINSLLAIFREVILM